MSLLLTLKKIFTLGLFSNILGSSESSEVNQNVRGLLRDDMKSFAYFVMHSYYYLNITPLIEMSVYRSEDCGMSCLKHVSCLSYNVAAFRDLREQKTLCELLPSDKYNESNRFSPSQHYHHFSIMIPCSNKPCTNGARCVAKYEENDYQCFCVPGYTGRHCRTDIDECSSSPCLNSGSCSDHVNSYTCNCLAGFTGVNCETNINECSSQPCLNGGTCVDGINMFRCNCIQHTTGLTCATINVTSPIALYPLNAAYTSKDSTGNQPDGITSNVTLAVGPDGNSQGSYQFFGEVSSYVELPNNGGLDIMHSMTLVMWVYSEGTDGPLFNYRPRGNWATHFWVNGGQFFTRFVKRNDEFVAPLNSSVITTNRWYYVGTSYDYNTGLARLWVDGVEVHQLDVGIYTLGTVGNVRIGVKSDDNRYFKGRVAKVQVYNLTLTLEQVQAVKYRG